MSRRLLTMPEDGDSTTSLGNLCHCSALECVPHPHARPTPLLPSLACLCPASPAPPSGWLDVPSAQSSPSPPVGTNAPCPTQWCPGSTAGGADGGQKPQLPRLFLQTGEGRDGQRASEVRGRAVGTGLGEAGSHVRGAEGSLGTACSPPAPSEHRSGEERQAGRCRHSLRIKWL